MQSYYNTLNYLVTLIYGKPNIIFENFPASKFEIPASVREKNLDFERPCTLTIYQSPRTEIFWKSPALIGRIEDDNDMRAKYNQS